MRTEQASSTCEPNLLVGDYKKAKSTVYGTAKAGQTKKKYWTE